ncbi:MAG: hypothetical protein AVDCRST_MAG12-2358 [uncultured Rubrobacteraceae bacterium]|uniref:Uncharacterized protein n=1 Tax=uncultured Rubrobacteraceae bacterium TaxID=349277 RepID=A0A6J4SK06_9ACTN|nr:MAG: hypothetical protein AVDCRST_MAG12-2358 [uncultured Rubrobacteraceae bacterium]
MAAVSGGGVEGGGVSFGRLVGVGVATVAVAVLVNVVIRTAAVSVLGIGEGFLPLGVGPTVVFTVAGMVGAVVVFGLLLRFAGRPVRTFRRVALAVLLVSLVPDVLMLFSPSMPGTTVAGVLTLMVEHVASWAVAVGVLTRFVGEK